MAGATRWVCVTYPVFRRRQACRDPAGGLEAVSAGQKKTPAGNPAGALGKALAMTYSRMRMHTTIGAAAFHFRVRNGIGWFHSAMVTRERVEGRGPVVGPVAHTLSLVCLGSPMELAVVGG